MITGFIARHSAGRLGFLRPLAKWVGNNKALFTVICLFAAFMYASFGAFDAERSAREKAEHAVNMPRLDPLKIYLDGIQVAVVAQMTADPNANTISFGAVTASQQLDMSRVYDFRDWKILCAGQATAGLTFGAFQQITYPNVVCKIQGLR